WRIDAQDVWDKPKDAGEEGARQGADRSDPHFVEGVARLTAQMRQPAEDEQGDAVHLFAQPVRHRRVGKLVDQYRGKEQNSGREADYAVAGSPVARVGVREIARRQAPENHREQDRPRIIEGHLHTGSLENLYLVLGPTLHRCSCSVLRCLRQTPCRLCALDAASNLPTANASDGYIGPPGVTPFDAR